MKKGFQKISDTKSGALALASVLYLAIVAGDYANPELNLSGFYLLIVLYVSWSCGGAWGTAFALMCVATEMWLGWLLRVPFTTIAYLYLNIGARLAMYALTVVITSKLRKLYERGQHTARKDFLTGAANRMAFTEALSAERARQRRSRKPLSIVYIDCDNFKSVNDRLGHAEGDKVLQEIVKTASTKLRETDTIARLGGDEFALILPETDGGGAAKAISSLREALRESMRSHGWPVTFSMGLGTFVSLSESLEELVSISDALMYEAKRHGKDTVVQREYATPETPVAKALP